jgi:hypothetical protein
VRRPGEFVEAPREMAVDCDIGFDLGESVPEPGAGTTVRPEVVLTDDLEVQR